MADLNIGLRQARRLAEMPIQERLGFIAEGLPVIRDSARSLLAASKALPGRERETDIPPKILKLSVGLGPRACKGIPSPQALS
jgi:hypothetical protein